MRQGPAVADGEASGHDYFQGNCGPGRVVVAPDDTV
jgi:hypothetical protein